MLRLTEVLNELGIRTHRFDFSYMTAAKEAGKPRPPSPLERLLGEYEAQVEQFSGPLVVGGKSLGGRVASHLATRLPLAGWVAFGYPFHPPGKPERLRTAHLDSCLCPGLVLQGERDPFGKRAEVESYQLPDSLEICWLQDGDHQLKPPKRSPASLEGNLEAAALATQRFLNRVLAHSG